MGHSTKLQYSAQWTPVVRRPGDPRCVLTDGGGDTRGSEPEAMLLGEIRKQSRAATIGRCSESSSVVEPLSQRCGLLPPVPSCCAAGDCPRQVYATTPQCCTLFRAQQHDVICDCAYEGRNGQFNNNNTHKHFQKMPLNPKIHQDDSYDAS